jgi:hypothetical protein
VSLTSMSGAKPGLRNTTLCVDGAGPVIWKVTKTVESANDRHTDRVRVTFSEKVYRDGKLIEPDSKPIDLFVIYERNSVTGAWDTVKVKLDSIPYLTRINDSIVEFIMVNGADLNQGNYMNIDVSTGRISDQETPVNKTQANNRIVRIEVIGNPNTKLVPVPNPTRPTFVHVAAGGFNAWHEPKAINWVKDEGSGAVLRFSVLIPDAADGKDLTIRVSVKVYDIVGNEVNSTYTADLLRVPGHEVSLFSSAQTIDLYWNGSNRNGMPCSPGVYRAVVYIDYAEPSFPDQRLSTNVGIGK